jgi:general secretion pathway protein G
MGPIAFNNMSAAAASSVAAAQANINTLKTNLIQYRMRAGRYPTTAQGLQALITRPTTGPQPMSWSKVINQIPLDPWGHPFIYLCPGRLHPDSFDIWSAGPDGIPGTDDDVIPEG